MVAIILLIVIMITNIFMQPRIRAANLLYNFFFFFFLNYVHVLIFSFKCMTRELSGRPNGTTLRETESGPHNEDINGIGLRGKVP